MHGREVTQRSDGVLSRDRIQEAFRAAAKRHHPDTAGAADPGRRPSANETFRECNDARELLLDYYVRRRFVPLDVVESTKDHPPVDEDASPFSKWTST